MNKQTKSAKQIQKKLDKYCNQSMEPMKLSIDFTVPAGYDYEKSEMHEIFKIVKDCIEEIQKLKKFIETLEMSSHYSLKFKSHLPKRMKFIRTINKKMHILTEKFLLKYGVHLIFDSGDVTIRGGEIIEKESDDEDDPFYDEILEAFGGDPHIF